MSKHITRKLTPTECGRLQAFPMENWEQVVTDSQAYKQFGNAVTVTVTKAIAQSIKNSLIESRKQAVLPHIVVIGMLEDSGTTHQHNNRVHSIDGISPTLTAVCGGTHHIKIFDEKYQRVRKLTPKEYGRLQGFPVDDNFEIVVSDSQAYKQFGNSVTVNVVKDIAERIKKCMEGGASSDTG